MRGALRKSLYEAITTGIIPAHAGSTHRTVPSCRPGRDHPRARGEHSDADLLECLRPGSSPRMRGTNEFYPRSVFQVGSSPRTRGTLDHAFAFLGVGGIIPAHAGNTRRYSHVSETCWDHPRACGEHMPPSCSMLIVEGSSPHMRGTHRRTARAGRHVGIIPAHAGNTIPTSPFRCSCRDHPRACGEHIKTLYDAVARPGSSPRMRGTPISCSRM